MTRIKTFVYKYLTLPVTAAFWTFSVQTLVWAQDQEPVDLAIVGPMVGTSFSVGIQFNIGVTAAIASLPDGQLLGRPVRVTTLDDTCVATIAERVALDLMQSPPDVVIGHSCSATTIASAPIYAEHEVLQISPSSTHPQATEMGITTLFRMIGRDDVQAEMAAERIAEHHAGQEVGMLFYPTDYSQGLVDATIRELAERGITPAIVVQGSSSAISFVAEIQEIVSAGVDVLYFAGGALDGGVLVRQARQIGAPFEIIGSDTLVTSIYSETAGEAGDNIPFTFPVEAASLSTSEAAIATIREMGHEPAGYTLLAYAATQTWIEGVRRAESFDANAVAAAIRSAPVDTILGPVSFDEKGDIRTTYPAFTWYVWRAGERVPLE